MDEEDGRPGPRARQFGPFDVPMDVLVRSLCHSAFIPEQLSPFIRISIANSSSRESLTQFNPHQIPRPSQVEDTHHENVPGK
jgi:hypothetical protein